MFEAWKVFERMIASVQLAKSVEIWFLKDVLNENTIFAFCKHANTVVTRPEKRNEGMQWTQRQTGYPKNTILHPGSVPGDLCLPAWDLDLGVSVIYRYIHMQKQVEKNWNSLVLLGVL